jgi:aldehyde:ferredoxin oxidoreductase
MKPLVLRIDLSSRTYEIEDIAPEIIRKYIGGRGLGAYLLYQFVPPKADPLSEENHLIFTAGPASGSGLYYSSKAGWAYKRRSGAAKGTEKGLLLGNGL